MTIIMKFDEPDIKPDSSPPKIKMKFNLLGVIQFFKSKNHIAT